MTFNQKPFEEKTLQLLNNELTFTIFEQITERSNEVFFIFDLRKGQFIYLSAVFEQIWQQSRQRFLAHYPALLDTIHPEDQGYVREMVEQLIRQGEKKNIEFRMMLPDAALQWICVTAYLINTSSGGDFLAGSAENITKGKEYTMNLLKYNAKKDSTLEILSHDLASPLKNLQGLSTLLSKRTQSYEDEKVREVIEMMQDTCQKGIDLIRDFVAQEFLESSNVEVNKLREDLVEKIGAVIDQYKTGEKNIAKTFRLVTSSKSVYAEIDDMKFMQVINNLISNAIKFTPDRGIITVRIDEREDSALITVEDNGIGIPAHLQAGLFEKFTKARRPGLKGEKSTGLGMSIIKTIVEWHSGQVWFDSREGEGSRFYIEIPRNGGFKC